MHFMMKGSRMNGDAVFFVVEEGDNSKENNIGYRCCYHYPKGNVDDMKDAPNHFFFLLNTFTLNKLHRLTKGERRKVLSHISSTR